MHHTYHGSLEDVILKNQNLIRSLSKEYDYHLRDDLFQVGVKGMIDAYNRYDPHQETKFTSYAYSFIEGEMKKFVREERNMKISRDIIYLCSKIERAKDMLRQVSMREPTLSELALFLEIGEDKITEALQLNISVQSIDAPINDEGKELTIKDVVSDVERIDKLDLISLRDELSRLTPREKELLERRYFEDRTQCETAVLMGMSQVEVSRAEKKIILSLRKKLQ